MKNAIYSVVAAALLLTGCSSAFKTAETPDDVYYSYGPKPAAKVEKQVEEEGSYSSYWDNADDRYLRMKVQDREKWSTIDDADYWYGYNNPATMYNNSYAKFSTSFYYNSWAWNSWYNPFSYSSYYSNWNNPWCWNRPVVIINKYPAGNANITSRPGFNKGAFSNSVFERNNVPNNSIFSKSGQQQSGYGNRELFRTIFGSSSSGSNGSSNSSSWGRPSRTFDNSSSGSSMSSGSSRTSGSSSSGSSSSGSSGSSSGGSRGGRGGN